MRRNSNFAFIYSVADLRGAPRHVPTPSPPTAQHVLNFIQFFQRMRQDRILPSLWRAVPSYGESWICPCLLSSVCISSVCIRCGSRIWSRGGPQVLRPKVADVAKRSRASEASNLRPGSRARLRALEAFGFLMLKYAFSHILETLFL